MMTTKAFDERFVELIKVAQSMKQQPQTCDYCDEELGNLLKPWLMIEPLGFTWEFCSRDCLKAGISVLL